MKNSRINLFKKYFMKQQTSFTHKKIFQFFIFSSLFSVLCITSCSRNSDWVQFRGEGGRGESSSRIVPPLGLKWKINLQSGEEKVRSMNPPIVLGDTIYFGSDDGNFYALDVDSGYMRWVFKSGAEINSIPYADKDKVYFGSKDGKLYALLRETGEEAWSFQTRSQINSQVQRYGDYIIFVGDADAIYFLNPDGIEQFRLDNPGWAAVTFLIADDIMYNAFGPTTKLVGPFDIKKREILWYLPYQEIDAIWYSPFAAQGDYLYCGTADIYDGMLLGYHAFSRKTGALIWSQLIDGKINYDNFDELWQYFLRNMVILDFLSPTIWRDLVIFTGGDNTARAFDTKKGDLRWEQIYNMPVSSAPTLASGRVYFGLLGDDFIPPKFLCISARDGKLLWEMETEGSILSAPVIAGKRVIFGTDKNVFYVLEQVF